MNNNVIEEPEIQQPEDTGTEQTDSVESRQQVYISQVIFLEPSLQIWGGGDC